MAIASAICCWEGKNGEGTTEKFEFISGCSIEVVVKMQLWVGEKDDIDNVTEK